MMRKMMMHTLMLAGLLGLGTLALTGCEKKSDTENALDNAAEQVEDAAEEAGEALDDAADAAGDAVDDATGGDG